MDFDYKKYSLEKLEEWIHDAISCAEASPQEIYDIIKKVVDENYHIYKNHTERCYELLCLLNGNGKGHIEAYDDYIVDKTKYKCDKDDPSPKCKESWNNFWEEHYYPEEVKDDCMPPWGHSDMEALSRPDWHRKIMPSSTQGDVDKVKSWILPVDDDYNITFPKDFLEKTGWKEGDILEWIDQGDGSFKMVKKESKASWVRGNELSKVKTYQEMIDDGWSMTDDGFWIKEN